MTRFKTTAVGMLAAAALTLALAVPALAGPQPLPAAACTSPGNAIAHGAIPAGVSTAHERVPHTHPPATECVHFNPAK
jgi:hypothetical protein